MSTSRLDGESKQLQDHVHDRRSRIAEFAARVCQAVEGFGVDVLSSERRSTSSTGRLTAIV